MCHLLSTPSVIWHQESTTKHQQCVIHILDIVSSCTNVEPSWDIFHQQIVSSVTNIGSSGTRNYYIAGAACSVPCVKCHVSCAKCHMAGVTCEVSHARCHITGATGWVSEAKNQSLIHHLSSGIRHWPSAIYHLSSTDNISVLSSPFINLIRAWLWWSPSC